MIAQAEYKVGDKIFDRYEVASHALIGGMGVVYLCFDKQEQFPVALKTLRPTLLYNRAARDRFLQEGTIWLSLGKHPNIVQCYEVERSSNGFEVYLVLELIAKINNFPNASLRPWLLPGKPLPVSQSLLFGIQIVEAMKYATSKIPGFVHRDLKPENILVSEENMPGVDINLVKITDFGIANIQLEINLQEGNQARLTSIDPSRLTQPAHRILGTPLYMAPEQWKNDKIDVRTDIYAMGCILYEMFCGEKAAKGDNLEAIRALHCGGRLQPVPDHLPREIRECLKRCLAQDKTSRYSDWNELKDELLGIYTTLIGNNISIFSADLVSKTTKHTNAGWSYLALGAAYLDISEIDSAFPLLIQAIRVAETQEDLRLKSWGMVYTGLAHNLWGDNQTAIDSFEKASSVFTQIGDLFGEIIVLYHLAEAHRQLGHIETAMNVMQYIQGKFEHLPDTTYKAIIESVIINEIGLTFFDFGNMQAAISCFERVLLLCRQFDLKNVQSEVLNNLGEAFRNLADIKQAVLYHKESLHTARLCGNVYSEIQALACLGTAYYADGNMQSASEFLAGAVVNAEAIRANRLHWKALVNLGNVYSDLNNTQEAIYHFEQALSIAIRINDRLGEGDVLYALGEAYINLGLFSRAIQYLKQARQIYQEYKKLETVADVGCKLAILLSQSSQLDQLEEAVSIAKFSEQIFGQIENFEQARKAKLLSEKIQMLCDLSR